MANFFATNVDSGPGFARYYTSPTFPGGTFPTIHPHPLDELEFRGGRMSPLPTVEWDCEAHIGHVWRPIMDFKLASTSGLDIIRGC